MSLAAGGIVPPRDPALAPFAEPEGGECYIPRAPDRVRRNTEIMRELRDRLDLDEE